jgi:hypothetical protein
MKISYTGLVPLHANIPVSLEAKDGQTFDEISRGSKHVTIQHVSRAQSYEKYSPRRHV